ncbi:MAG: GIY-YIG nuclease family protein [Alphaproteobacteria bacterium]|nr:GIY-YIG nuclease family protein [Alphaproteobacteria bacterium]
MQSDLKTNSSNLLTNDEKSFLTQHKLSADDVLDGRNLSKEQIKQLAKQLGKKIYIGGRPCEKHGHRLRTRSGGHCVQCDTSKLAYSNRHSQSGYVYIAASISQKLIKIGITKSINERRESLAVPDYKYAGLDDLRMLFWVRVENYGEVESKTHIKLKQYKKIITYKKGGDSQDAHEIFQCSFVEAKAALDEALAGKKVGDKKMLITDTRAYEW